MAVDLYMDVHIPLSITTALRRRAVNVLTAEDDGNERLPDPLLLDRATMIGKVLVSEDADFLVEASRRQAAGLK